MSKLHYNFLCFHTNKTLPDFPNNLQCFSNWLERDTMYSCVAEVENNNINTFSLLVYLQKKIIILVCLTILLIIVVSTVAGYFGF